MGSPRQTVTHEKKPEPLSVTASNPDGTGTLRERLVVCTMELRTCLAQDSEKPKEEIWWEVEKRQACGGVWLQIRDPGRCREENAGNSGAI